MDSDKIIKIKTNDGKEVDLSSKAALRSGLLKGMMDDYQDATEFSLNNVDGDTLVRVKDYLTHYQNEEPKIIEKPLKSNDFKDLANEWDYKFLDLNDNDILAIIKAANFMDIKPLLELVSVKITCKLRGTTTQSIRKDFNIDSFNKEEEEQIIKDKEYLEQNL